jgi:exodeoxyribonuclease-3
MPEPADAALSSLREQLHQGVSTEALLKQFPSSLLIPELYQTWRAGSLEVLRRGTEEPEPVPFSAEACLLPGDQLRLGASMQGSSFKVATWNVNSIRSRWNLMLQWLESEKPEVVGLQETKTTEDRFPVAELQALGYHSVHLGQKTYNGVALLSRHPISEEVRGFPEGWDSENARLIRATISGVRMINVYVPQGSRVGSEKFHYKLEFLEHLKQVLQQELQSYTNVLVMGDFNVALEERDVYSVEAMRGEVSFHPDELSRMSMLQALGLEDLFRRKEPSQGQFSWWDFRTRGFERGEGLRIDYVFGNLEMANRLKSSWIDFDNRAQPKPSDHAPVMCTFELETTA